MQFRNVKIIKFYIFLDAEKKSVETCPKDLDKIRDCKTECECTCTICYEKISKKKDDSDDEVSKDITEDNDDKTS